MNVLVIIFLDSLIYSRMYTAYCTKAGKSLVGGFETRELAPHLRVAG